MIRRPSHASARPAFTLLEMMVGITIIVLLAALAFVSFSQVRQRELQVRCMGQLRSWAGAIANYSADNGGRIAFSPWAAGSNNEDDPKTSVYMRYFDGPANLFAVRYCPCMPTHTDPSSNQPPTYVFARPSTSNGLVGANVGYYSRFDIARPDSLLLLAESIPNSGVNLRSPEDFATYVKPVTLADAGRHGEKANLLFADGHIEARHYKRKGPRDKEAIEANTGAWLSLDASVTPR